MASEELSAEPSASQQKTVTGNGEVLNVPTIPTAPEPKLPTRKDASLKEFLGKMDDYAPIVRRAIQSNRVPELLIPLL